MTFNTHKTKPLLERQLDKALKQFKSELYDLYMDHVAYLNEAQQTGTGRVNAAIQRRNPESSIRVVVNERIYRTTQTLYERLTMDGVKGMHYPKIQFTAYKYVLTFARKTTQYAVELEIKSPVDRSKQPRYRTNMFKMEKLI